MAAQLQQIPTREMVGEPNADVIENLENMLGWARIGGIQSICAVVEKGGELEYSTSGIKDRWRVLGFLSHLAFKLNGNH